MTLNERYYAINSAIIGYLKEKGIKASVIKYGINPALLKDDRADTAEIRYPYFQSFIDNKKPQAFSSRESGVLMNFDYQLNFYTGPFSEFENDSKYFYPFEVVCNVMGDVRLQLLNGIANVRHVNGPYYFDQKSGQVVPSATMIYNMQAVCSYEAEIVPAIDSTDLDAALQIELKAV